VNGVDGTRIHRGAWQLPFPVVSGVSVPRMKSKSEPSSR